MTPDVDPGAASAQRRPTRSSKSPALSSTASPTPWRSPLEPLPSWTKSTKEAYRKRLGKVPKYTKISGSCGVRYLIATGNRGYLRRLVVGRDAQR